MQCFVVVKAVCGVSLYAMLLDSQGGGVWSADQV